MDEIEDYVDNEAFKKDKSKVYKSKTHKERIFEYLKKAPIISLEALYNEFPQINRNTVRVHLKSYRDVYQAAYMKEVIKTVYEAFTLKAEIKLQLNTKEKKALKKLERWLYD